MATGTRRKYRELAMQMLFQADIGKQQPEDVRKTFWATRDDIDLETRGFADDLFRVASTREEEIRQAIEAVSKNWRMERMPAVDRNVLRMAVGELLAYPDTAPAVVIDEALEIARRYSAPESVGFLNGVLDAVRKRQVR
jgi:N utilization substance protein B